MNARFSRMMVVGLGTAILAVTGCRKDASSSGKVLEKTTDNAAAIMAAASDPGVVAKLAAADAVDGAVDGVVSRCAGCSLHMEGDDEYALTVGKHTMHFCSDSCRSGFASEPMKRILALSIPDGD